MIYAYAYPTRIESGEGVSDRLAEQLKAWGIQRPLFVTDRVLSQLPIFKRLHSGAEKAMAMAIEIYCDFAGNPIERDVVNGVQVFKAQQADAVVIIGGGAALDVGKAIALMACHDGNLFDYEDRPGCKVPQHTPVPIIAIPTTAGTGSEVGRSSVISDNESHEKKIIFTPLILPKLVYLDPNLTIDLPKHVTAATGFDALTHLIEAYLAKGHHPLCEGIAMKGIELVAANLKTAYEKPHDIEARLGMLEASMMGAVAFQKGLGAAHSAAHALSTVFDMHHGTANALMLPAVLNYLAPHCQKKFELMSFLVGRDIIDWVIDLRKSLGLEEGLKAHGVTISKRLIDIAIADVCHQSSPVPLSEKCFKMIFGQAL